MSRPAAALSPSRAKDFNQCPLLFRFRTVDRLPEPPSLAATKGTLVHAVLERLYDLPAGERSKNAAVSLVDPSWQTLRESTPDVEGLFPSEKDLAAWLMEARALVAQYFRMENPKRLEPQQREAFVETRLENGINLRGIIDRVDQAPNGAIRIVDYKSGRSPRPAFESEATFQLLFYGLIVWRETGVAPTRLQLIYLGDGRTLSIDPTEHDLLTVESEIERIWGRIEYALVEKSFPPRRSKLCGWCNFQEICPEFGGTPPPVPQDGIDRVLATRRDPGGTGTDPEPTP